MKLTALAIGTGAEAVKFRLEQPNAMYDGHAGWLSSVVPPEPVSV